MYFVERTYMRLIDRRTVLKGLGATLALPWLDAMGTATSWAAPAAGTTPAPNRMAFLYVPNGKNMADWTPKSESARFGELPAISRTAQEPQERLLHPDRPHLGHRPAHGDGGGDHARLGAFTGGCQPRKTDGVDIRRHLVDQVAAGRVGDKTRLPSIEIGGEAGSMAGKR